MTGAFTRMQRVGEQIRRELAAVLPTLMSEYPQATLLSFTAVKVVRDLSKATVYVTLVLPDDELRESLVKALNDKSKLFRHHLSQSMRTRTVPELTFVYDESVEYGAKMEAMLEKLVREQDDHDNDPR